MFKKKFLPALLHVLAWSMFFLIPFISADHKPMPHKADFIPHTPPVWAYVVTDISLLVLFYFNYLLLFPHYFKNRRFVTYGIALLLTTFIIYAIQDYVRFYSMSIPAHNGEAWEYHLHLGPFISIFFLVVVLGTGLRAAEEWLKAEQRNKEIETEKLDAELASLKAQINPHFLFNALNTIYSLTITESDKAGEAVVNLSKMMRYVMHDSQQNVVALTAEIDHLGYYIDFQKMRVNPNVTILFSKNIDTPERYTIAPLILIPFIENAFKHGISTQQNCTIQIQLDVYNGQLVMQVTNHIYRSQSIDNSNAGIGIANTQRRLGLVYPGSHDLKITEENNTYTVNLKIKLV